jgi:hypothetical protein
MRRLATVLGVTAMLVLAGQAGAAAIDTTGSYDGTYQPDSATPPAGQSTWVKTIVDDVGETEPTDTTDPTLTWNDPSAGLATFDDPEGKTDGKGHDDLGEGYVRINRDITGSNLDTDPANTTYYFEARVKVIDVTANGGTTNRNTAIHWGFKDEGGSGKTVVIGFKTGLTLRLNNDAGTNRIDSTNETGTVDGFTGSTDTWYTIRVEKFDDAGTMKIKVLVDGVQKDLKQTDGSFAAALPYSDLENDDSGTDGFWMSTHGAHSGEFVVDYVEYAPEPATMVLLGLGGVGLLLRRRRR